MNFLLILYASGLKCVERSHSFRSTWLSLSPPSLLASEVFGLFLEEDLLDFLDLLLFSN